MWTTNRAELSLRKAHPEWYQVNAQENPVRISLYNREHYRFLCPTVPKLWSIKERVREIAQIGSCRYPYGFYQISRCNPSVLQVTRVEGVVQDRVYPLWDFATVMSAGLLLRRRPALIRWILEISTSDEAWMQFRYDRMAEMASAIAAEIKLAVKVFRQQYSFSLRIQSWCDQDWAFP